jgi:arginine decarboxylase
VSASDFDPMLLSTISPHPRRLSFDRVGAGRGGGPPEPSSLGEKVYKFDSYHMSHSTHVQALDNLSEFIAATCGARAAYPLVNGTTSGNLAMVLASVQPGQKIIVPRNAHKSVLGGIVMSGAAPVFLQPEISEELRLVFTIRPQQIAKALAEHPDAGSVLVTNPTYQGFCLDLREVKRVVQEADATLLVDEAHGPHFAFHESLPLSAMKAGADMAVQSTHKILGACAQSSVLLVGSQRVDEHMLRMAISLISPSNPSRLFTASLEAALRHISEQRLLDNVLEMTEDARKRIDAIPGIRAIGRDIVDKSTSVVDVDLTKLVVDVSGLNVSGYRAARLLHDDYGVSAEMAGATTVTLVVTIGNTREDMDRCVTGMEQMAKRLRGPRVQTSQLFHILALQTPAMGRQVLVPRAAFFAKKIRVPVPESAGKISGESVIPYPPGIPVLVPGEEITPEIVEYLTSVRRTGVEIHGSEDRTIGTLQVVDEREFLHSVGGGWS